MVGGAVGRLEFSGMRRIKGMHRRVPKISGENCSDLPLQVLFARLLLLKIILSLFLADSAVI